MSVHKKNVQRSECFVRSKDSSFILKPIQFHKPIHQPNQLTMSFLYCDFLPQNKAPFALFTALFIAKLTVHFMTKTVV